MTMDSTLGGKEEQGVAKPKLAPAAFPECSRL